MFREFISIRNGLLIATAFMIGFVWHRAGLPPAGLGLVDGVEPRPAKFVVQVRDTAPGTHKDHKIITGIFNESRIPHFKIVMMGDSITAALSWSELLVEEMGNRVSVIRRGSCRAHRGCNQIEARGGVQTDQLIGCGPTRSKVT